MTLFPPNATKGGLFSNGSDAVLPLILLDLTLLLLHETGISKMFLSESNVCCQRLKGGISIFQLVNNERFERVREKKKGNKRAELNQIQQRLSKAQSRRWHACISANFHQHDSKEEREQQTKAFIISHLFLLPSAWQ